MVTGMQVAWDQVPSWGIWSMKKSACVSFPSTRSARFADRFRFSTFPAIWPIPHWSQDSMQVAQVLMIISLRVSLTAPITVGKLLPNSLHHFAPGRKTLNKIYIHHWDQLNTVPTNQPYITFIIWKDNSSRHEDNKFSKQVRSLAESSQIPASLVCTPSGKSS